MEEIFMCNKRVFIIFCCKVTMLFLIGNVPGSVMADDKNKLNEHVSNFSVKLDVSRIIYPLNLKRGTTIKVTNPQNYPILVQSTVFDESKKNHSSFIVTPPLFRLDENQTNQLRVIRIGGIYPEDRETLQWLCIKGIPPKNSEGQNTTTNVGLSVQVSVNTCIKIFIRPSGIKEKPEDIISSLTWNVNNKKLVLHNPTPFYINMASLKLNKLVANGRSYVSPFSDGVYELPANVTTGIVFGKLVTDYGSLRSFQFPISK